VENNSHVEKMVQRFRGSEVQGFKGFGMANYPNPFSLELGALLYATHNN